MMGRIVTAAAFVFVIMMLASCTTTGFAPIPDALLTCKDEPKYQQGRKNVSVGDVIEFADEVALAGADCRSKVGAIRKIEQARKSKNPGD